MARTTWDRSLPLLLALLALFASACRETTGDSPGACADARQPCGSGETCCAGLTCNATTGTCDGPACVEATGSCAGGEACCGDAACVGGTCVAGCSAMPVCLPISQICERTEQCCGDALCLHDGAGVLRCSPAACGPDARGTSRVLTLRREGSA